MATATIPPTKQTDLKNGLSTDLAKQRLVDYGPNDPAPPRRRSMLARFLVLF